MAVPDAPFRMADRDAAAGKDPHATAILESFTVYFPLVKISLISLEPLPEHPKLFLISGARLSKRYHIHLHELCVHLTFRFLSDFCFEIFKELYLFRLSGHLFAVR